MSQFGAHEQITFELDNLKEYNKSQHKLLTKKLEEHERFKIVHNYLNNVSRFRVSTKPKSLYNSKEI